MARMFVVSFVTAAGFWLLVLFSAQARADVVCDSGSAPTIRGKIVTGDFRRMLICLDAFVKKGRPLSTQDKAGFWLRPVGWAYFNSEGGDVNEAIKIGRFLRQGLAEVVVQEKCFSACFLAVVGAVVLYAGEPFGKIGIHRVFHNSEALQRADIKEYEAFYNELRKGARQYLYELDVPTPIVEKMFAVSSRDLYILSDIEMRTLGSHPAYEEWISARCPARLSDKERKDHEVYVSSGFKKGSFSDGYVEYLNRKESDYRECVDAVRWAQFGKTVAEHFARRQ